MFVDELREDVERLCRRVASANPSLLSGTEASEVVDLFSAGGKACDAGVALFADRVAESGAYADTGHRSAAEWLGEVVGESAGRAKGRLEAAHRMKEMPELEAAVRRAEVSSDQAQVIADAAVLDPGALTGLLGASSNSSFSVLKDQAAAVKYSALSEEDHERRQARVHGERHVRSWDDPMGGVRGGFLFTKADWGRCSAVLEPKAEEIFRAARKSGEHESRDRYMADALVALLTERTETTGRKGPKAMVHLRVNVESLRRGAVKGDEVCEVQGVGPVPVSLARSLFSDCVFDVVIRKGADVVNITGKGHTIPDRLRAAVYERDRHCQWPNCTSTVGLEIHHWRCDVQFGGKTVLSDLRLFCGLHHDKFTYGGWRAEVSDDGVVRVMPPVAKVPLGELERRRRRVKEDAARKRQLPRGGARAWCRSVVMARVEVRPPSRT